MLDTSVVVASLAPESRSEDALRWLAAHELDDLAVCDWTLTEFSSAMSAKLRSKQVSRLAYVAAHAEFENWVDKQLIRLPLDARHFEHAASFCNDVASGLRAPDALHLAASFLVGGALITLDEGLHRGARIIGLNAELAR